MWLKLVLYLIEIGLLVWSLFTPSGRDAWGWFFNNVVASAFKQATPLVKELGPDLEAVGKSFSDAVGTHGDALVGALGTDFQKVATKLLQAQRGALASLGESTPANAIDSAAEAFKVAMGAGLTSASIAALFEALFPEKLNTLNGVAPMIAKMAGFDEVAAEVLGPLYKNAFGRSLEYQYRSLFKPELPDEADAVTWHARRKLTDAQLRKVFSFSGLKAEYETPFIESAYRPVQPRLLMTAYIDQPFPRDEIKDLLQFTGYRDADIELVLHAFEANSTKNVRQQFLSAVITAAERGTLTDAEVDNALTNLNFSDEAKGWVKGTIATRKLEQLAEIYRKSISEAYKFGQITDAQYVPALEAIGIAEADANAHFAVDSIALRGHEAAAAARAAAKVAAQTTRAAASAAIENYQRGNIDAVALAAALAAAGIPPTVIPFAVDLQSLKRDARRHNVFGLSLGPERAVLVREQVAALKEQTIKKAITVDQAKLQLQALGLPAANIDALIAAWNAQVNKTALPI